MLLPICFYLSGVDTILTTDVVFCDRCYVRGWNVMRSILEKHQEHLEQGIKNI